MIQEKVAVLLSTYNGEKYLEEYLSSLRSQTWQDITLIVRDDGSSDRTLQIVEENQRFFNCRILPSSGNLGPAKSFLSLLTEAGSDFDYYAFADQDDIWLPEKISRAISILKSTSQNMPTLYCSGLEYVDENLQHLKWFSVPRKIDFGNALVENIATGCTVVINNTARNLIVSNLPEKCLMHDWWLYLVISCFGKILWDNYSGIKYRQHENNVVGAATTFFSDMKRRTIRFLKADKGIFALSDQATLFYTVFNDRIPDDKRKIIELIMQGKNSLFYRIKLAFSIELWRQRHFDNLIMRVIFLINRY